MKYGICTNHNFQTSIGAVYILEDIKGDMYLVKEGNCDAIRKDAITLISKDVYEIIRLAHNEVLENINMFSENTREYYENLYKMRNKINNRE